MIIDMIHEINKSVKDDIQGNLYGLIFFGRKLILSGKRGFLNRKRLAENQDMGVCKY